MAKDRPIELYVWQLLKATLSVVAVILYSRVLGATGRGSLSIYLLYVQVFLMLNELFVVRLWPIGFPNTACVVFCLGLPELALECLL